MAANITAKFELGQIVTADLTQTDSTTGGLVPEFTTGTVARRRARMGFRNRPYVEYLLDLGTHRTTWISERHLTAGAAA